MMMHSKYERVLLVAPNIVSLQVLAGNQQIKHVTSASRVFPAIYEMAPNIIVFDYDYLCTDMEKILRRIRTNSYYNKIKICCFRSSPDRKIDGFLKVLGVDQVIYKNELRSHAKTAIDTVKSIFDSTMTELLVNAAF